MIQGLKVAQYGIGEIGSAISRLLARKKGIEIVGAYDIDERKVGKDLGEVAGLGRKLNVKISDALDKFSQQRADVILHSTSSKLEEVYPQLQRIAADGVNIISTCEELSYPYRQQPQLAVQLDKLASKHGITILGTGVNPGFVMDFLPLVMTGICQKINEIQVTRVMDAAQRRHGFQKKIGIGLTQHQFEERVAKGGGHVGLTESIAMIADGLGWQLRGIRTEIEPVIAENPMSTEFFHVKRGAVSGIKQVARGMVGFKELISLELDAYLAPPACYDEIRINGQPNVTLRVAGGIHGDLATSAVVVNAIPRVIAAKPGLKTMKDLPAPLFLNPGSGL